MQTDTHSAALDKAIAAVVWLVAAGAALYLTVAFLVDWRPLRDAFAALGFAALAGGLLLASLNYTLRFVRWQDLLRLMRQSVPWRKNLRIYLGGLALTATPAKLGETIRSALLLRWRVPVAASLVAFFLDRLTDLIAVLLLAALSSGGALWWTLAVATVGIGMALRYSFGTQTANALADWLDRHHQLRSLVALLRSGSSYYIDAWQPIRLVAYVALAVIAYGLQGLVFAAYVDILWAGADWKASLHIFATSTLAGAASMIPGGLGAMELASIAQLAAAGMPLPEATAAALALRAVTLWFAILLGLFNLAAIRGESVVGISR